MTHSFWDGPLGNFNVRTSRKCVLTSIAVSPGGGLARQRFVKFNFGATQLVTPQFVWSEVEFKIDDINAWKLDMRVLLPPILSALPVLGPDQSGALINAYMQCLACSWIHLPCLMPFTQPKILSATGQGILDRSNWLQDQKSYITFIMGRLLLSIIFNVQEHSQLSYLSVPPLILLTIYKNPYRKARYTEIEKVHKERRNPIPACSEIQKHLIEPNCATQSNVSQI